jgi:integrase
MKVTVEDHQGRYRLRWQHQGKRYTLSCGVPSTPTGKAVAKMKAAEIEKDLACGYFDPTLLKYRPRTLGKTATEITAPELFKRFSEHKRKDLGVSDRSIETRYKPLMKWLEQHLSIPAEKVGEQQAKNFKALLLERVTGQIAKERLWLLQGCWQWAVGKYHLAAENPWVGLTNGIKPTPTQKPQPFAVAEVQAILAGFKADRYYAHYYPLVAFMFGVGCRFGEAAGLQWKHLSPGFETAWIGESVDRNGKRKSTKTGKARTVLLSPTITAMLGELHQGRQPKPDDLVFPAPKGGPVNDKLFNRRAWKTVLERVNVFYRKPYGMRHTAISHALANGAHHLQVAQQTGHDPRVLYASYASVIETRNVFVEF